MPPSSPRPAPTSSILAGNRRGRGRTRSTEADELPASSPSSKGSAGYGAVISIDTRKGAVARAAAKAGAKIFNDVSALTYDRGQP